MPTLDASSPVFATNTAGGLVQTTQTALFDPPADSWFYYNVAGARNDGGGTPAWSTPTNSGNALTWEVVATQNNASGGAVRVWRAYNASAQTNVQVTAVVTWDAGTTGVNSQSKLDVWTGCNSSQTGAASAASTSTTQTNNPSVTTTATGSRVVVAGYDWNAGGTPTSSDTMTGWNLAGNGSGGRAYKSSDSGAPGSVSVNFVTGAAGPIASFVAYEILGPSSAGTSLAWITA